MMKKGKDPPPALEAKKTHVIATSSGSPILANGTLEMMKSRPAAKVAAITIFAREGRPSSTQSVTGQ
jgi:hypothetical protein